MNTLIISAHPKKDGFVNRIAETYKANKKLNENIFHINLYETEFRQNYLEFEPQNQVGAELIREKIHQKIFWADQIIIAHPVWWIGMPAVLKNFLDQNLTSGFAFKYVNHKPVGLLKNKTAKIFVTADAPWPFYLFEKILLCLTWRFGILGFCGIKIKQFKIFSPMRKLKESKKAKILESLF